ncbi:ArdC family protein [Sphingomonas sanxanigenens]|uniref:Antirestriction protein ArdC n=1 Tax=Sphingomonas sanxanigenens DSM 19645 = NX02 TaxID=1123269 RepID=A0A0F7JWM4_9SPHN|nr:zincin-like metallopeptidase domain-containing protein [Sphingomonas sanxanigenens]AKH18973.1 hypothetical protein NX02_p1660 [Sphingomonas sanxanigenens DSM 19645 = NX02]
MTQADAPRRDAAAEITNLIIRKLEEGVPPWRRPWRMSAGAGQPLRHCGTPYSGINRLYLWAIADARGYASPYWMTARQAEQLGGRVRRHEQGSVSVFFSRMTRDERNPSTGETVSRLIRFLRSHVVYAADQIDGLPDQYRIEREIPTPLAPSERQNAIDRFFSAIPSTVRHGGNEAFYHPTADYIQMPHRHMFRSADLHASTLAHEHIHWTANRNRLARAFGKRFGDNAYAFEELVADVGAGLVCADLGLPNEIHDSHASYLASWLSVMKADKTAIITAAAHADRAWQLLRSYSAAAETGEADQMKRAA